ncbi:MAG: hypothetical protein Q9159_003609 [Coniocarpon cinnabarinum]
MAEEDERRWQSNRLSVTPPHRETDGHTLPNHPRRHRPSFQYDDERLVQTTPPASPLGFEGAYFASNEDADPTKNTRGTRDALGEGRPNVFKRTDTAMSTTRILAQKHGVRHPRLMYLDYYLPSLRWIQQYKVAYLTGDLVAALTMASFYIPMSLSYAANLGHLPPVQGLYSFVFNPLVYALLGTCPQMIVGPEAPGSLLLGGVVVDSIRKGHARDEDGEIHAQIAGVVTGIAGAVLLLSGFARLGFLDNVLSRPFLRGFISAIGIVIIIDQLIPEMGLSSRVALDESAQHGSTIAKAIFIVKNIKQAHGLTSAVSFGTLAVTLVCREVKRRLQPRYPKVAYIPDRFLIVVTATLLAWNYTWADQGLAILGEVKSQDIRLFQAHFPLDFKNIKHLESALSSSFLISLLGFFESSVAAKSLGAGPPDGIQNIQLSANRELVGLGAANIVGGIFMALPAFGGYGRSKVNASTGGKTPMSSVFLSLITLLCTFFLLPAFFYIPKGVLCAMISVVAWSLVEEAPHDLMFFWHIRGWAELFLVFLVFVVTILYSLSLGIACGIGFSLLRVIKHSTRPRIQILGRVHQTSDQFENAEADPDRLEFIEGCLIIKIPEPLTFANTGDLRNRLRRLEQYGTANAHPALPRIRHEANNKNIIFDIHGVTSLDGAGAQVLFEILASYRAKNVRVFFCRVPHPRSAVWKLMERSGIVDVCGGPHHFVESVSQALRMTELESSTEPYRDNTNDVDRQATEDG